MSGCARLTKVRVSSNGIRTRSLLYGEAIWWDGNPMAIDVAHEAGSYRVSVSPPHSSEPWQSRGLLTATEVLEELSARGCHSTDVTDALYTANPQWAESHDAEVRRRREKEARAQFNGPSDEGAIRRGDK